MPGQDASNHVLIDLDLDIEHEGQLLRDSLVASVPKLCHPAEETGVGTPSDYSDVSKAIGAIYEANYNGSPANLAWIHHPRDGGTYDRLVDTNDGQPLHPTPWVAEVRRLMTTSLAPDSGNTEMIVGHFPELLVGMRTSGVVLDVIDSGTVSDASGNTFDAASEFYRFIRARIRLDALMLRPDWFTVLRGVTAS